MMATLVVIGRLDAIVDRRVLVAIGLLFCVVGFWRMTGFNLAMDTHAIVLAGALQGIGQGIIFVPLATLAFATVDPSLRPEASAITNLVRNLAGSLGIALMQALTAFNTQAMHTALAAHLIPGSRALQALPGTMPMQTAKGAMALNAEITRQAMMVAYVDDFWLMIALGLICIPLLLLLRKPRPGSAVRAVGDASANTPAPLETGH
jgi:DHA2 family multidrug resistance protein